MSHSYKTIYNFQQKDKENFILGVIGKMLLMMKS